MATVQRDYYEVLGVPRDADEKAIKAAFRRLALMYHPDRSKEPGAEERFKEVAEAYAVLSDPKKRAEYDARGFDGIAGFSREDLFGGIDFGDLFRSRGFDFGGAGFFDRFFAPRRGAGRAQGENIEVQLVVPLERVLTGGEEMVRFTRPETCPICHGSGAAPGTAPRSCETCKGSGQHVIEGQREGNVSFRRITTCPACQGRGTMIDKPCPDCRGLGKVEREEALTVKIPIGGEEGMVLRVPGRGHPGREAGGTPGDLYVIVHTAPDPRFERRGADLWRIETIEVVDAVLGVQREIPTLNGPAKVTIPAGTQPGTVLRLRRQGVPEFGSDRRGELYVAVHVHVPERLSRQERELYQQLRSLEGKSEPLRGP